MEKLRLMFSASELILNVEGFWFVANLRQGRSAIGTRAHNTLCTRANLLETSLNLKRMDVLDVLPVPYGRRGVI